MYIICHCVLADLQTAIGATMRQSLILSLCCLLCPTVMCHHARCESLDVANPFSGLHCPIEGTVVSNLHWHQCKLFCLQTPSCQAVNYNFTANLCTYFTSTCPRAFSHPDMAFNLFTGRQPRQCIEWIPKQDGQLPGDRSVTEDNERYVARLQKDGNDFVCYFYTSVNNCFSLDDEGEIFSRQGGYPCQYLQIREGCTVLYVDYELDAPIPPNALIGGYTAEGLPVYIGGVSRISGYYIPGSNRLVAGFNIITGNVKLLVSL